MLKRTAIIHIGTPKTGTTAIQHVLGENRDALLQHGFCYPRTPGSKAHTSIGAFMSHAAGKPVGLLQRRSGPIDKFVKAFQAEVTGLPDSVRTVILSSEHAFNQGLAPGVVPELRRMMDSLFHDYRIVVYFRRQDEQAVSLFSTLLRAGRMPDSPFPMTTEAHSKFDFFAGIQPWVEAFGKSAIVARVYQRSDLRDGDIVSDFLSLCGVPALPKPPGKENSSLMAGAQEFLRQLNALRVSPAAAEKTKSKRKSVPAPARIAPRPPAHLREFLSSAFPGKGIQPQRDKAVAFYAGFAESNERLRATFFPERKTLFNEDFSRYPEEPEVPSSGEVLTVALAVTRMQTAMIAKLQSARTLQQARDEVTAGRRNNAIEIFVSAVELDPNSKPALGALLAFVDTPDEVFRARQFVTGARIPKARKDAALKDLDTRFGAEKLESKVAENRKAERRAQRRAARLEGRREQAGTDAGKHGKLLPDRQRPRHADKSKSRKERKGALVSRPLTAGGEAATI